MVMHTVTQPKRKWHGCHSKKLMISYKFESFFQRIPEDYDPNLLSHQDPVSFHKYIRTDPFRNYDHYFRTSDDPFRQLKLKSEMAAKEEL